MNGTRLLAAALLVAVCWLPGATSWAAPPATAPGQRSLAGRELQWPGVEQWRRVVLLRDYNTRVVVLGTMLLGCAAGMVGSFALLRKRALMGDALSHATLPGIAVAFLASTLLGGSGKSLPWLLLGATLSGLAGVAAILAIRHATRLKEDTALGAVLSVFFGAGIALLGVIQQMSQGHAAGLEAFIYGKTASMGASDAAWIAAAACLCIGVCGLLFKELQLLCFDQAFAGSRGFPVLRLDWTLMALVVCVTIVGLQAVGLVLMIALLVIPAAAARFWTERMGVMILISALLGTAGSGAGAGLSALFSKLPSGAMIVLVCTLFFLFSMLVGPARGVLPRLRRRRRGNRLIDRQHLLRAAYEILEQGPSPLVGGGPIDLRELASRRSWSATRLRRAIRRASRSGLVRREADRVYLTERGLDAAARITRQHRLWEIYLITHADVAPGRVDREADAIEHVLGPELVRELERELRKTALGVPPSPHELPVAGIAADARGSDGG